MVALCVFCFLILYYLKPSNDRLYIEAYNCVDSELNQTVNSNIDFETAFEQCSIEIHRLTKSVYQEIIADGKSNYVSTNIDYYFYKATGYFVFGMDETVKNTMQNTIQEDLKQAFQKP